MLRLDLLETGTEAGTRRLEGTRRRRRLEATSHLKTEKGELSMRLCQRNVVHDVLRNVKQKYVF